MLNQSAIERGLFVSTYYRTYKEQNNKNHSNGEEEFFTKPATTGHKTYNYDKLDDDGFVPEDTFVQSGDIIIGKCMPNKIDSQITYKDNSVVLKENEKGFIDRNCYNDKYFCNINGDGYTFAKVRIRSEREPTIGDKFSSRSSQKGVTGMLYKQQDMPFTKDGIVPDIIMNPHAIPSRMTIGQLMECVMGKACAMSGTFGDATPFNDLTLEEISAELEKHGMERYGNEVLYNGFTGEQMTCDIFMGPTYYQRLKHMTADKIHCLREDHDVLTERGWVPIGDVTLFDKVATLKDGEVIYECPYNVWKYDNYIGKMYKVTGPLVDLDVTINHRMWVSEDNVSYKMMTAQEVYGKKVSYLNKASWTCPDYDHIDACMLMAVYVKWLLNGCNPEIVVRAKDYDDMENTLIRLGCKHRYESGLIYVSCDYELNKMPYWVWLLSAKQAQRMINVLCTKGKFVSPTKGVADDFVRLCLHAGYSCVVENNVVCYVKVNAIVNEYVEEIYDYEGPVYCLEVPNEVFYVKRNGKAVWTGNSRANNGPIVLLTRQPAEGRARLGGLRAGEMETECLWAHGVVQFLKERFMECSDNYKVHVCKECGLMAIVNPEKNIHRCDNCKNNTNFAELRIPYSAKLLLQEMQTMNIGTRFLTE